MEMDLITAIRSVPLRFSTSWSGCPELKTGLESFANGKVAAMGCLPASCGIVQKGMDTSPECCRAFETAKIVAGSCRSSG